jgi:hypothetical protein
MWGLGESRHVGQQRRDAADTELPKKIITPTLNGSLSCEGTGMIGAERHIGDSSKGEPLRLANTGGFVAAFLRLNTDLQGIVFPPAIEASVSVECTAMMCPHAQLDDHAHIGC